MKLIKPKYAARDGSKKATSKWYVRFRDHKNRRRSWPLFKDKRISERCAERISQFVACCQSSEPMGAELSKWFSGLPDRLQEKFAEIGMIDRQKVASSQPFEKHLEGFERFLRLKDRTKKHVSATVGLVRRVINGCEFKSFNDIAIGQIDIWLESQLHRNKKPIGKRTYNAYVKAVKQFGTWAERSGLIALSPVRYLSTVEVLQSDKRKRRRVLEVKKLIKLLKVTKKQPERCGMTGSHRALAYRLACESGLRANEIRSLTVSSFDTKKPTVTLPGDDTKNSKPAVLPLRSDMLEELKPFLAGKMPHIQIFPLPAKTAEMLRLDLKAAEIPYKDESGLVFDFHALRHQFGSLLAASGTHPKTAQVLMRHSSIELTLSIYTHVLTGQEEKAIDSLPDLTKNREAKKREGA